jgi:hypothetical protein
MQPGADCLWQRVLIIVAPAAGFLKRGSVLDDADDQQARAQRFEEIPALEVKVVGGRSEKFVALRLN